MNTVREYSFKQVIVRKTLKQVSGTFIASSFMVFYIHNRNSKEH